MIQKYSANLREISVYLRATPLLLLLIHLNSCTPRVDAQSCETTREEKISGLNFTAPSRPFPSNPMPAILGVNANWIAVLPFGYTRKGESSVRYNLEWQWWGERQVGVRETIRLAKKEGILIMLKPQVYMPGSWVGHMDFEEEADWKAWEKDYRAFILSFAATAEEMDVEMFCIGTEYEIAAVKRPSYWRALIAEVRTIYKGKLTYAANWDGYWKVPFWDALDYAGVNSYFPLVDAKTPQPKALLKAWKPHLQKLDKFYCEVKKPIIFTEYGYLSVDGSAHKNWELEANIKSLDLNEQAQANAYAAFFEALTSKDWWQGGFLWKWFPNDEGHEGYYNKDYTPQGKLGEAVLREWYGKDWE